MDKVKLNYGKYSIPKTLDHMINLQKQLNDEGLLEFGDIGGLYFSYDEIDTRYLNTPIDVISFARPGSDGVHFGFLTDFGQVSDLESAFIVRVSPMDFDNPVQIVARNIHDFLRLLCYAPSSVELVDITTDKEYFKKYPDVAASHIIKGNDVKVREILKNQFALEPIDSLYAYLQTVKQVRENEIVLPTEDGIGVISKNITNKEDIQTQDLFDLDGDTFSPEDVKNFFETSSYEARLVFLRDAQSKGLLYDYEEMKNVLQEQLRLMHLDDDAKRVMY
ncbi:hypothetical protein [Bacillus sp. OAE603]|uniref:hypothetical protein n=1 Tax=Gottfriedia sp. OAE603 TaxID=2663872 RepID=UPI00178B4395